MNIILFKAEELECPLPVSDQRARHVLQIIRAKEGDTLKGGIINGPLVELKLDAIKSDYIFFRYQTLQETPPSLSEKLIMIIGTPRPPTARRLLKDLTTIGTGRLIFTGTDLNEKSYLSSKLWKDNLFEDSLIEGAQQAGTTLLPRVDRYYSLKKSLESLPKNTPGIYLHAGEQIPLLNEQLKEVYSEGIVIALGPERGWTERERILLQDFGFKQAQLGRRILRTETAAVYSAMSVIENCIL